MKLPLLSIPALIAVLGISGCAAGTATSPVPQGVAMRTLLTPLGPHSIVPNVSGRTVALCPPSADPARASCLSSVRTDDAIRTAFPDAVNGLTPADLASIYGYPAPAVQAATTGAIGIVVAFDNPQAEADLGTYRSYFGLPACTSANGCFRKITALPALVGSTTGAPTSITAHPTSSIIGWAAEGEADLEAASAVCARCRLVLVEAASDSLTDLGSAVTIAGLSGAAVVDASFGAPESPDQLLLQTAYAPLGARIVAAAGDSGRGVLFPAAEPGAIAVAGTTLQVTGTSVSESLWSGSGGGCSAYFPRAPTQPSWCAKRSVADLAVVADPNTGLAFYDGSLGGWLIVGGTSISAPIVSGMIAISGPLAGSGAQQLYADSGAYAPVSGGGTIAGLGAPASLAAFSVRR